MHVSNVIRFEIALDIRRREVACHPSLLDRSCRPHVGLLMNILEGDVSSHELKEWLPSVPLPEQ